MSNGSLEFLEPQLCSTIVQSYEGELDDSNIYCGKGELKSVDGSYEGMFLNGVFHGKGSYRWANDVTYEGDFQEGTITGTGTYTWPDGSTYRGEVRSGKRHGKGVFKCSAGQIYDGEWYNGYRHGSGTVSYEEGKSTTVYSGEWHMGKRQGKWHVLIMANRNDAAANACDPAVEYIPVTQTPSTDGAFPNTS